MKKLGKVSIFLIFTLSVLFIFASTAATDGQFNYKTFYKTYTWETFSRTSIAKRPIDFNQMKRTYPIRNGLSIYDEYLCAAVFYATNRIRARFRRPRFKYSRALQMAAEMHSRDMVRYNFMGHYSRVSGRRTPSDRIRKFGQWRSTAGENVALSFAIQYRSGSSFRPPSRRGGPILGMDGRPIPPHTYWSFGLAVVNQWMNSPGHRRNILNSRFKVLGTGSAFYYRGNYRMPTLKATQVFAGGMNDEMTAGVNSGDSRERVVPGRGGDDSSTGNENQSNSSDNNK